MVKSKRSQVTIFIIIAILIVSLIMLFFFLLRQTSIIASQSSDPQIYMAQCAEEEAEKAIGIMLPQGGFINPDNYKLFQDKKVGYLCYNKNYYYPCIMQEPLYIEHLEEEIKSYIKPRIESCFSSLKQELERKNYNVKEGDLDLRVELGPRRAEIIMNKELKIEKNDEKMNFDVLRGRVSSPLYNLAVIAQEIASQEAKFCYFEYLGYMLLYPEFTIDKFVTGDDIKIYSITEKSSGKMLRIAIRSCARSAAF